MQIDFIDDEANSFSSISTLNATAFWRVNGRMCRVLVEMSSSFSSSTFKHSHWYHLDGAQQTELTLGPMEIVLRLKGFDESGKQVFGTGNEGLTLERKNPSKAPISIKPGTGRAPDLGPYELEQADEDD